MIKGPHKFEGKDLLEKYLRSLKVPNGKWYKVELYYKIINKEKILIDTFEIVEVTN